MRIPFSLPFRVTPALFPIFSSPDDVKGVSGYQVAKKELVGWDAVKGMFELDEWGDMKPEMANNIHAFLIGMVGGAAFGGVMKSRHVYEDFIRNNHATAFQSHLEAKRSLQTRVSISFGKGAFYYGWRSALFTGTFAFLVNSISLYKGRRGVLEYVTGGVIIGALFRLHFGLPGMIVGAGLGGFLGFVSGALTTIFLSLGGFTFDDVQSIDSDWEKQRKQAIKDWHWDAAKAEGKVPTINSERVDLELKQGRPHQDDLKVIEKLSLDTADKTVEQST